MSRRNKNKQHKQQNTGGVEAFTFGEPVSVLDSREIYDYLECVRMEHWYEPPLSFNGLSKAFRAAPHHSSAIYVKRNILTSTFIPHPLLDRKTFDSFALDFLMFGNAYVEARYNRLGGILRFNHAPAKYTRRGIDGDQYWFTKYGYESEPYPFEPGAVFHLIEPDVNQELYGLPEYLAALPSTLLNESATLFRRRYYLNGSHAGYIMYISDSSQSPGDIDNIRKAVRSSKGPGNFRNLFLYAPNGKKDGIQIMPLSEVAAKDEFLNIKNVSRDDMLAAHRVPPQLMGILPQNTGGFGDVEKAAKVFVRNELMPLQAKMKQLNDWCGQEVIRFEPYTLDVIAG